MTTLSLVVQRVTAETATIRRVVLAHRDGAALPGFAAGAHITLEVPGVGARKYSLVSAVPSMNATASPRAYELGVRLESAGGGGSAYVHRLAVGDAVVAEAPLNNFPLKDKAGAIALIAGGIGVTPLLTMAAALKAQGRAFHMVYAARAASEIAFAAELNALAGAALKIHTDDTAGHFFDMTSYFSTLPDDTQVYMCGPKPMLKAGMEAGRKRGWPRDRVAFELFYSVAPSGT